MLDLIRRYQSRLYPFIAVIDQALLSAVNLLTNVFLIRYTSKTEYGLYGVGFTSILLIMGLTHALFSLQMIVIAPDKPEAERKTYFGAMFISMSIVIWTLCGIALLGASFAKGAMPETYRLLIMVLALSAPGILTMEFMRQCLYFYNQAHRILVFDLVFLFAYFLIMLLLVNNDVENLHYWAFLINGGLTLVLGLIAIQWNLQIQLAKSLRVAKSSFIEAWHSGAWAILGSLLAVLQQQGYVYLLAIFRGPAAVAEMNAARLFLSPLLVMSAGFTKVMIPKLALLKSSGEINQAVKLATKVMFLLITVLIVYMGFIALGWDWFANFMADKGYTNLWILVALWGLYFFSNALMMAPNQLLQVFRRFRLLTTAGAVAAVVVLSLSVPAIVYYGAIGAVVVLIIGETGFAALLWNRFQKVRKNTPL